MSSMVSLQAAPSQSVIWLQELQSTVLSHVGLKRSREKGKCHYRC